MVQVTYPGVYIQEVSSGVHTITGVSTSITAFVDFFREGPMDEAVEIFGMTDFQRTFGGLDDRSEASYAIAQFFLNGGSTALVIRSASADGTHPLRTAGVKIAATTAGGSDVLQVNAASAGLWGNTLRAEVDLRTADSKKLFNLTVTRYDSDQPDAQPVVQERHLNLSLDPADPRFAPDVVNNDSQLVQLALGPAATATSIPATNGTVSANLAALAIADFDGIRSKKIRVAVGSSPVFEASFAWAAGEVTSLIQLATRLEAAIRTAAIPAPGTAQPTPPALTGATVQVISSGTERRLVLLAGRGDPARSVVDKLVVTDASAGDTTASAVLKLTTATNGGENVQQYPLGSAIASAAAYIQGAVGADGLPPDAEAISGAVAQANQRGMYALDTVDLFNILCIPRAALLDNAAMTAVVDRAIAYCEAKRAFFLLDLPQSVDQVAEVKDWLDAHGSFRHRNAALYFPRLQIPDPLNEYRLRSAGTSGTIAGIYARTDSERGVWKAPAGIDAVVRGIGAFDLKLTDAENGTLNPLGIDCLRSFPVYGNIVWGARTTLGADQLGSEWKYVPIRRLALFLEESLFRGTKWVVFEPNDEPLWAKIRLNVGAFMTSLFRQGAFQGTNPKDAFFVKCDGETTTQDDRNKGIVNILVGFAPLKPAEFVVISIQQIAGNL
jgi:phage tail sheath protein FI